MLYKLRTLLNKRCYCEMEISNTQLEKMVQQGAILVDVRSVQEFEEGHLEEAISLPVYEIKRRCEEVLKDKNQIIVVYCSSGYRSAKAQKVLKKLGYKRVYDLCEDLESYNL